MKNRKSYFIRESKEQKSYLEILKDMLPFETEWKYHDDAGDFLVDINNPKRFVIQYGEEGKHKGEFIVNRRITKGADWTWSTRFFKTIPEAIEYLKTRLNESRTYFGDEIKEVVDWLIESPYNNWQEKDREYLMNCDNEKLFKYESDTFDLECAERSLYESNNYGDKNMKFKEGPSPKWKQKILDDENEIFDAVYSIVNDENGEWKEPEKYLSFSVNKFIAFIKKLIDAKKYSENLLKEVAINLWIDLHCDSSAGDFNDLEVQRKYVKYQNLSRELWNSICDEYQAKYGRKRNPQPYIKDPIDASEIFDKMSALKYESKKITQKRIEESFKRVLNEWIVAQNKFVIRGTFEHNGEKYNLYYGESGMGYDSFPCWEPYLYDAVKFKEFPSEEVIKNIVNETDKNNDDNILNCLKVFNIKQGGIYTNYIDSKIVYER